MAAGDVDVSVTKARAFNSNVFDGADDYVEIPHNAAQLGANLSNGFTISAWVNIKAFTATAQKIFDKSVGTTGQTGFSFAGRSTGANEYNLAFYMNNSTIIQCAALALQNEVQKWKHVLFSCNSTPQGNFYINGTLNGTANQAINQAISTITTTNPCRIGNRSAATDRPFNGAIRNVKMWNRVLTTTEIAQDYAGTCVCNGLIHHFKLGGDYNDYGSVGVTATNSGSIPFVVEDTIAAAIKTQRATAGATGKYLIAGLTNGGQVITSAITEA